MTEKNYSANVSLSNEQLTATTFDLINVTSQSNAIIESVKERNNLLSNSTSPVPFVNVIDKAHAIDQNFATNSTLYSIPKTDDYKNVTAQPNRSSVTVNTSSINYTLPSNSTSSDYIVNTSESADSNNTTRVTNNTSTISHDIFNFKSTYSDANETGKPDGDIVITSVTLPNVTTSSTPNVTHYSFSNNLPILSNVTNASTHSPTPTNLFIPNSNYTLINYDIIAQSKFNATDSNGNIINVTTETVDGMDINNTGNYLSTTEKYNITTLENTHIREKERDNYTKDTKEPNNDSNSEDTKYGPYCIFYKA
ncbi:probable cyclin-dependent serine/threonine-protein kinase DDB_G0292550 [Hyposmocoma kahamanoa]|uniref:probable cyclin-dependent serine/threonine-protein kinase DDB_G0292550 n=1 Tax=Hyposmocoma kahamanoa TaxID=1477025 RepID=UPI000E6D70B1|nr:probable cyclin-dependent serine/threonine-protein kinase DDB_G0292550 [Hyposmocoma kahamanoa]